MILNGSWRRKLLDLSSRVTLVLGLNLALLYLVWGSHGLRLWDRRVLLELGRRGARLRRNGDMKLALCLRLWRRRINLARGILLLCLG